MYVVASKAISKLTSLMKINSAPEARLGVRQLAAAFYAYVGLNPKAQASLRTPGRPSGAAERRF